MATPTRRGAGLILTSVGAYLAGRLLGTWELYLVSLSLGALVVLALLAVVGAGRRIAIERSLEPAEPVAGTSPRYAARVANLSWLPTPSLRITEQLGGVIGDNVTFDVSPLGPRAQSHTEALLPPVRRGIHDVGRLRLEVGDPLGIARRRCDLGEPLRLIVIPKIGHVASLVFFGGADLGELTRARLARSLSSTDIRGVRPHLPGEPLNRIDWKSTARTGSLMLRETEEPSRTDVVIVLDGTEAADLGDPPDTSFETAVAAAGTVADYVLREGLAATFIFHGADRQRSDGQRSDWQALREVERFDGRSRESRQMLERLAAAGPQATEPLSHALARHEVLLGRGAAVIVVSSSSGASLRSALAELTARAIPVFLVYVDALSFAGYEPESDAPLAGFGRSAYEKPPATEQRRFLLSLAAAGIPSVVLRRGDDPARVLQLPSTRPSGAAPTSAFARARDRVITPNQAGHGRGAPSAPSPTK